MYTNIMQDASQQRTGVWLEVITFFSSADSVFDLQGLKLTIKNPSLNKTLGTAGTLDIYFYSRFMKFFRYHIYFIVVFIMKVRKLIRHSRYEKLCYIIGMWSNNLFDANWERFLRNNLD